MSLSQDHKALHDLTPACKTTLLPSSQTPPAPASQTFSTTSNMSSSSLPGTPLPLLPLSACSYSCYLHVILSAMSPLLPRTYWVSPHTLQCLSTGPMGSACTCLPDYSSNSSVQCRQWGVQGLLDEYLGTQPMISAGSEFQSIRGAESQQRTQPH